MDTILKERLSKFHSLFDINIQNEKHKLNLWIAKLEGEEQNPGFPLNEERIRAYNVLSYFYWHLNKERKAHDLLMKSLKISDNGIVANANYAWMLYKNRKYTECRQFCDKLDELSKNPILVLDAKSEKAFCYRIMGMDFYDRGIEIYQDILDEASLVENSVKLSSSSVTLWRFGLGVLLRRLLNVETIHKMEEEREWLNQTKRAASVFYQLIQETESDVYKARSFAELGVMAEDLIAFSSEDMDSGENIFPPELQDKSAGYFYQQALNVEATDLSVLQLCGKYLRHISMLDEAKSCFETAFGIRQTSLGLHHFGLVLKDIMERDQPISQRKTNTTEQKECEKKIKSDAESDNKSPVDSLCLSLKDTSISHGPEQTSNHNPHKTKSCSNTYVKCRQNICHLPYNKQSEDILLLFEESYEMNENTSALYDKGLMLRAVGEVDEAINVFLQLGKHPKSSLMDRANSFEQHAWCLLEKLPTMTEENKKENEGDIIHLLMNSIELTAFMERQMPTFKGIWGGLKRLRKLLEEKERNEEILMQLSMVHEKVGQYKEVISLLQEVVENRPSAENEPRILTLVIDAHLKMKDYSEAICKFALLLLADRNTIDHNQYIEAHILGAFEALANGKTGLVNPRFKNAFYFGKHPFEKGLFDVFIRCPSSSRTSGLSIMYILKYCDIEVTMNDVDAKLGRSILTETAEILEKSKHFIIVVDDEGDSLDTFTDIILRLHRESVTARKVAIVKIGNAVVPKMFHHFPTVDFALNIETTSEPTKRSEADLEWVSTLLRKLLRLPDLPVCVAE